MKSYLLERARQEGTPLIDGRLTQDGAPFRSDSPDCHVTFLWSGKRAPRLSGDFNYWACDGGGQSTSAPIELDQVEPSVWAHTRTFPRTAYVEYVFLSGTNRINDPLNWHKSSNGIGGINNYFYAPDAAPTPFLKNARKTSRGLVTTHTLRLGPMVVGGERKIHLYQPPTDQPVALIVALDGQDYLRRAKLPLLLDNLYAQNKIPPLAVAMVENSRIGKGSARMVEYACNELTLIMLIKQVVPFAQQKLNLLDWKKRRRAYAIAGASMGGLQALFTSMRAPEIFGTALSQAGAFELWNFPTSPFTLAAQAKTKPRVWLDVGQMDWLLEPNRRLYAALKHSKFDVSYREYFGYHNWVAWRNILPDALMWAFPKTA